MADIRSFLDNLKNLRLVISVALEHVQENRNQFVTNARESQLQQFERYVSQIRGMVKALEKEFNTTEYLIEKKRS
jgi:hypothetical protein